MAAARTSAGRVRARGQDTAGWDDGAGVGEVGGRREWRRDTHMMFKEVLWRDTG